jgi:hypothetical protein
MSKITLGELIKNIKNHKHKITQLDNKIKPLYDVIKYKRYNHNSIEYSLKNIIRNLNKWKNSIKRNENNLIDSMNSVKVKSNKIKLNLVQLNDLQHEHESICKNQYLFIRYLND